MIFVEACGRTIVLFSDVYLTDELIEEWSAGLVENSFKESNS